MKKGRYKTWLKQAEFDLSAAKLSFENGFYEWAAYQSEQTVEKALKSVIIHAGRVAPKIHKLSVLFGICNTVNKEFRNTKFIFRHVESFAFISRYPFLIPGKDKSPHELITEVDSRASIEEAESIMNKIKDILKLNGIDHETPVADAITQEQLDRRLDEVREVLVKEFNPEKIILFGSYARKPLPGKLTTIDILMIARTELDFIERIQLARETTSGQSPSIEPLVYTPEEFKTMTEVEGDSFFETALEEGRVIYEKP